MPNVMSLMPELSGEELTGVDALVKGMSDDQANMFAASYRAQRKDSNTILLLTILGFIVVAGVQRFYVGQIGMGLLYLFTGGLCLIGTIIDVINHKKLATEYNLKVAMEIATRVKA